MDGLPVNRAGDTTRVPSIPFNSSSMQPTSSTRVATSPTTPTMPSNSKAATSTPITARIM